VKSKSDLKRLSDNIEINIEKSTQLRLSNFAMFRGDKPQSIWKAIVPISILYFEQTHFTFYCPDEIDNLLVSEGTLFDQPFFSRFDNLITTIYDYKMIVRNPEMVILGKSIYYHKSSASSIFGHSLYLSIQF
jgi:hypothetical protein